MAMKSTIQFILRQATGSNVLLTGGAFLLMAVGILPAAMLDIARLSPTPPQVDFLFWPSPHSLYANMQTLGPEGRGLFRFILLTADMVFPIVYTAFFSFALGWLLKKQKNHLDNGWVLFPFLLFFFDLLENGCLVAILSLYPKEFYWLALLAGVATFLKWLAVAVILISGLRLVIRWQMVKLKKVKSSQAEIG
jgi:hypothetical protein